MTWRDATTVVCPTCGATQPVRPEDAADERVGGFYCQAGGHPVAMMQPAPPRLRRVGVCATCGLDVLQKPGQPARCANGCTVVPRLP
jgi:hypothetical protein